MLNSTKHGLHQNNNRRLNTTMSHICRELRILKYIYLNYFFRVNFEQNKNLTLKERGSILCE